MSREATDAMPQIVMDESGNTGGHLLDAQQPVFALAAARTPAQVAEGLVEAALRASGQAELKFSWLRGSSQGQKTVVALLESLERDGASAAVSVVHKPAMLAMKMIDELVEPRMLRDGRQGAWYASGSHVRMAEVLASEGPRQLGEHYGALAEAFAVAVRRPSAERAGALSSAIARARIVCALPALGEVLDLMEDGPEELRAGLLRTGDRLDPALPSLWWHAGHWSEVLEAPFEIVHDESTTVERWQELFETVRLSAEAQGVGAGAPRTVEAGEVRLVMPDHLSELRFGQSDDLSAIQVADVLAGAAVHLASVAWGLRAPDLFARRLMRAGLAARLEHVLGPPLDLDRAGRGG